MSVYKEIPKYNFKDVIYKKGEVDPETGDVQPVEASQERYLFYRINKKQDLAGITIPLYEEYVDPETGETKTRPILQEKTVQASTEDQEVTPDLGNGYLGLERVYIRGIEGLDLYTVTPTQNPQTINIDTYLGTIQVEGIDSTIDPDIRPANIRHDVEILGIRGTYTGDQPISPVVNGTELVMYDAAIIDDEDPNMMVING